MFPHVFMELMRQQPRPGFHRQPYPDTPPAMQLGRFYLKIFQARRRQRLFRRQQLAELVALQLFGELLPEIKPVSSPTFTSDTVNVANNISSTSSSSDLDSMNVSICSTVGWMLGVEC